jgi:hypothetical protein
MPRAIHCVLLALCLCWPITPARAQPAPEESRESPTTPYSVDRVRESLEREPAVVTSLDRLAVFRLEIVERRPRTLDLDSPFTTSGEPRSWTTSWHDEFLGMVTPDEARPYSPMLSSTDRMQLVGTSLAALGVIELATSAVNTWRASRRRGAEAAARREVDAALEAFEERKRAASP